MVQVIFTLDYEIHGNGEGCAYDLIVEPTSRLLRLFDEYGARLTIMADVGEILKFKEFAIRQGQDRYHYQDIVAQLQTAVRTGHDVQLHIHSSYYNATHDGKRWVQDWAEYNFASLPFGRMNEMVKAGKEFLETLLRPVKPDYVCEVFRAANWSVSPSKDVVRALVNNGVRIDTSVFKYGRREGLVNFDYCTAQSDALPWRADEQAIWRAHPQGEIWEVPIYTEHRHLPAFFSVNRIHRSVSGRFHRVASTLQESDGKTTAKGGRQPRLIRRLRRLTHRHAWKADFNQCTGRQLIHALHRCVAKYATAQDQAIPFVLIGHSKLFTRWNERTLRPFLAHVANQPSRFQFGTFAALNLPKLESAFRLQPSTQAA